MIYEVRNTDTSSLIHDFNDQLYVVYQTNSLKQICLTRQNDYKE